MFRLCLLITLLLSVNAFSFVKTPDIKAIEKKIKQMKPLTKTEQIKYKPWLVDIVFDACIKYDFDSYTVLKVIEAESGFYYKAKSHTGAEGLMQFTTITLKDYNHNVYNCEETIYHGVEYLSDLYKLFLKDGLSKDDAIVLAVASYNCGRGYIIRDDYYIEKDETRNYIKKIFGKQTLTKFIR